MEFVFYDFETTGVSPEFDQPLQFAGIRTNEDFEEIERVNFRCRLAPHILPSPYALVVTGIKPEQLIDTRLPSLFEFSQRLFDLTERWAPAIWLGYNSINFDEEVLRQVFYQNLLPNIFATQFNGNLRFDVMKLVYAVAATNPGSLTWEVDDAGNPILKLDSLAPANGFSRHNAHDAMGDVEATIHIAKKIKEHNNSLWHQLLENSRKDVVFGKLNTYQPHDLVVRFGKESPMTITGCLCGYSSDNPNRAIFFDLGAADPSDWLDASISDLVSVMAKRPTFLYSISVNKVPVLLGTSKFGAEHQKRAAIIAASFEFRKRVGKALAARFADVSMSISLPVEKQIYSGFYSKNDSELLEQFRRSNWTKRFELLSDLSDQRLRQLGRRLIAFNCPDLLSPNDKKRYRNFLTKKLIATTTSIEEPEWITIKKAREEIIYLREKTNIDPAIMTAIEDFYDSWKTN
ncbi:MAG: exonuclease domain-containing protein [Aestuariivita sp.]|nr:exonuclease domain-containing protein [Aestuariivita sp.]